jgi:hypothetical protein
MVLKNLTREGRKVLKKSSGKGPYVLRTDNSRIGACRPSSWKLILKDADA